MGTYDELSVGDRFDTPSVDVDEAMVKELIAAGGYTHPLFTDPAFATASKFGKTPLPGQAILLLLGGLVEQTGRFDGTVIALLGLDAVRFLGPAFAGDTLRGEVEVLAKEPSSNGTKGVLVMAWRCSNGEGKPVVESTARMLFRAGGGR
jgi:acyl dehydratase